MTSTMRLLMFGHFGVTMWEIFTCGNVPYNGIHAMGILHELERGAVLEIPDNKACSDDIYQVMSSCWKLDTAMRPMFSGLVTTINCLLEKDSGYLELLNLPSFEATSLPFIAEEETGLNPNQNKAVNEGADIPTDINSAYGEVAV
ncbi:Tyrosine kinase receptor Cad96Ca [Geodia barretti]|uniref:Tyrosine kinase receptor Cad96Ca n=1 Tax=Geodia barretti TaxID=519541 RepID=A0AA35XIX7_GEOBA|nr:Tyrosine kinase receptor Cad96Ca [Geodia barretti]